MKASKNLLNLFFPELCFACARVLRDNERHICTTCRHELPVIHAHREDHDALARVFYGRVKLEAATALLSYQKQGPVQQLIRNLKYKGHEVIGEELGRWLGAELRTLPTYRDVEVIIPVPLHRRRLRKRGYNQVTRFGQELAKALDAEYCDSVLLKTGATQTQVFKSRMARGSNPAESFSLRSPERIRGKHLLLVDDIVTTGATIEACAQVLLEAQPVKISMAAMAMA